MYSWYKDYIKRLLRHNLQAFLLEYTKSSSLKTRIKCLASTNAATYRLPATRLSGCKTGAPSQIVTIDNTHDAMYVPY